MSEKAIDHSPLIQSFSSGDVLGGEPSRRTGNVWSALSHIITGVIGAGVLSLAWSVAQLGWIAGPLCIIVFAVTTLVSANLLSDCYRFPDPEHGTIRSSSYMHAVKIYLGDTRQKVCGVLVHASLCGCTTAYVITTGTCIRWNEASRDEFARLLPLNEAKKMPRQASAHLDITFIFSRKCQCLLGHICILLSLLSFNLFSESTLIIATYLFTTVFGEGIPKSLIP